MNEKEENNDSLHDKKTIKEENNSNSNKIKDIQIEDLRQNSNTPFQITPNVQENIAFLPNSHSINNNEFILKPNNSPEPINLHPLDMQLKNNYSPIANTLPSRSLTHYLNGKIPTGPSYIIQINNKPVKIVELHLNKLDPAEMYTPYPMALAIIAFAVNIILPGFGTILGAIAMSTSSFRMQYFYKGICELITSPILIGWCLGLYNGITFILAACKGISVEEYILNS